ncbi:unnamed protein product [Schistosoma haematobium]|nr:unnamed protein product [Schistosoma haematobium]
MVIERLMKKMVVNPVPKKAFKPTTALSIPRHPMLTFGVSLEDVIERDKTEIPIVISDIFNFLLDKGGLQSEGIFRVNGNSRTVEILRAIVDVNGSYWHLGEFSSIAGDLDRSVDVFSVASLLKLYLRELPEGLIPENITALFLKIHSEYRSNQDAYLIQLENLVAQLPVVNYTLLKHLCQFLHRVSVYQSDNKMSIESLGIVFGPNVFRFTPENLGYREQNSINHIMGILIEHSDSLFRMIAPSCENVTTLNDNLSDKNYTQIQAVRNKKYNTSDNLSSVKSRNNEDDVDTDYLTQSTTKVETNHMLTHVTNTYCDVPQIGIKASTTPAATTTTKARKTVPELAKTNDIVDTNDNQFKRKSSTCDIISTYLEIAIRSCIQEHLFQERLSDFKVYDTADTVNNFNHSSIGMNQISKSDYSDVGVAKTNSISQANLKNPETNYSKLPSTTDRTNESNDQILNRLTYYLHNFKSRLREYEKLFEQDYGRKPTNSDKYSNPKIAELLRQLSEVQERIRQIKLSGKSSDGIISPANNQNGYSSEYNTYEDYSIKIQKNITNSIHNGNMNEKIISSAFLINQSSGKQSFPNMDNEVNDCTRELRSSNNSFPSKPSIVPNNKVENENVSRQSDLNRPTIESTFLLLSKRLTEKRMIANRPEDLHLMTPKQIAAEKLALQKALLYFENLHGRPKEHQDRITMRPLYDRYRSVKRLLNCLQSDNNLNIAEHIEETSDTELQSSVPSIDDQMRRRSILSPNLVPLINDSNIQTKSIHSTGTTSNSIASFKSVNPVSYSSLRSINRLYNPVSSIPDNNLPVPSMMSLSTSASFNLPIYSSITSAQSTLGNNNDHVNDRLDLARKQPTVTSIPSTIRYNINPNSTRLFSPNERPTYIDENLNKNNFAFNKQSYNLDSNVDLKYNEIDCDTKSTSDRNSRVPCVKNNEWFGTIGLSKRNQDNTIHNYHVNTFNCHSHFVNENNQHPVENALSTSTHTSTRLFDSVTCSNRIRSEFSSPIRQENFIGARAPYFSPPPLSSSFFNPKTIQANISNEVQLGTNPTGLMKNRRRFLDTSENAINTVSFNEKCTDSSKAISSSDFSSWSTADLKTALRTLRESKRQLQKTLKDFEHEFAQTTGQKVEREDRLCMRSEYYEYKALKTRLFQLETELKGRCA